MKITTHSDLWGLIFRQEVQIFSISRDTDLGLLTIRVAEYGATLQAVHLPNSAGVLRDVVFGHDSLADYIGPVAVSFRSFESNTRHQ